MAHVADEQTDGDNAPFRLMYVGQSSFQIERAVGPRLERLADEGFEVHVLAGDDGGFDALADRGLQGKAIPVGDGGSRLPATVGAFFIIQAHFIEHRPVLVHARDDEMAWIGAVAAERVRTPGIVASHVRVGHDSDEFQLGGTRARLWAPKLVDSLEETLGAALGGPLRRGWTALIGHLGEMCDKFLVDDERDIAFLEERELVAEAALELYVGGDGVDLERFNPEADDAPSVEEARRTYDVPHTWDRVIGYRGPLVADRGGTDLLDAIDEVLEGQRGTGWLVDLVEPVDAGMVRRLERRVESGRVRLASNEDVSRYYRCLDLMVLPGRDREAARVAMEAAAMKVPSVAYAESPAGAVVSDGHTGRVVPVERRAAFADVVGGLAGNPKRLEEFGIRARSRADERFDRRDVDDRILRLYDRLLSRKLDQAE